MYNPIVKRETMKDSANVVLHDINWEIETPSKSYCRMYGLKKVESYRIVIQLAMKFDLSVVQVVYKLTKQSKETNERQSGN